MKVTHVALCATEQSTAAGCPSLTPELLAATGARYSRNNEGLDRILERIDPEAPDASVDAIFRMVDYGHQSIADMAPVAMFIDGITIWLAYFVWSVCPTAGGQESSTRYIGIGPSSLPAPHDLGIATGHYDGWRDGMARSFHAYRDVLSLWQKLGEQHPKLTRIPAKLLKDTSEPGLRKVARMRRNYAFDRARYFLPLAATTNVMLVMSARAWVNLCQHLCSHPLPEANHLGNAIRDNLALSTPRLIRHAVQKESTTQGLAAEFSLWVRDAAEAIVNGTPLEKHGAGAYLDVLSPPGTVDDDMASDLHQHDNRYAWIGEHLRRTAVRFGWEAVTMAEIRDLNRHRTGTKYCPLVPQGFYAAEDQLPGNVDGSADCLAAMRIAGAKASARARELLAAGDPSFVYWCLLGTQFPFEHVTTADKFIYEAELRTGTGAHYRYAQHLHDALKLWYKRYPQTRGLILEGSAEPE